MENIIVYTAVIKCGSGEHKLYQAKSSRSLEGQIFNYVKENWKGAFEDQPIPKDKEDAVQLYFADSLDNIIRFPPTRL